MEADTPVLWESLGKRPRCSPVQENLHYLGTTPAYVQVFRSDLPTKKKKVEEEEEEEHLPITNTKDLSHLPEIKAIFI